ncbi:MAG: response regulator [Dissulfurispiraceae bacterium]|jgi:DNA-binding NtrC family response regulator
MAERLLIVDDEPDMLKLLGMIIRDKTQYETISTNNPAEALDLIKQGGYDLVITDLKMPGLDGVELLEAVKNYDADIPVIIITAFGTIETAEESLHKGAFDFITKPFRKEQILFTIEKAMNWLRLQRENKKLKERLDS